MLLVFRVDVSAFRFYAFLLQCHRNVDFKCFNINAVFRGNVIRPLVEYQFSTAYDCVNELCLWL